MSSGEDANIAELDEAYANAPFIPGADAYPDRWAEQSDAFRTHLSAARRARLGVSYGDSARQAYDLFLPEGTPQGVSVFVHGGYWLRFDRSSWSHLAAGILARGWACAMPSYDLCPEVRIADITQQIARMIRQVAGEVAGPLSLSGHSAGGHLVARMLAPGMLPPEIVGRLTYVAPISPVADLRPLLRTSMNDAFRMSDADAEAESPIFQPAPEQSMCVWVGGAERPVFREQAAALARAWSVPNCIEMDKHHFDVIEMLETPEHHIVKRLTGASSA